MGRISTTQQKVNQALWDARWEIKEGGWTVMEDDPPGCPHETKLFTALPDHERKLYWRPVDRAIEEYEEQSRKQGAIG